MKIMKKAVSILLTLTMVLTIFTVVPVTVSAASQSVTYVDGNGETQTVTAAILTGAETELSPGWYAVTEDIRFEDMVNLSAPDSAKDINLILCDSATMILSNEDYGSGFYSDDSVSLNIYGQSSGSGALKSQGGDFIFLMSPNSSLNIFGGELTSSYINAEYCTITCAGDINISGGSVEKCELVSYNNLTVSGGSVNVPYLMADQAVHFEGGSVNISNDGIYASSIIFNLRDSDASVKATGYDGSVSTEWYLTDGSNIYSVGEISDTSALSNKTLKMAGHVHTFSEPTWVWDGYEAATATFVCSECGETVVETAAVTDEITKAPTESETGITTYTATVTVNGTAYTDTKTKTTHVGNHTFGTPQWDWNGYESATVTVTCTVDGDSFTADAVISSEVTAEPTLTSEGKRVHTATATVEGQTFTDTKEETLPKITRDVSVSYRALNNRDVTVTAQKLYGDETELTDGWYAVTDDLTIDYRPNCTGTVNLILCDGVTFNANKGINVGDGATLTVWGQSEGTGILKAGEYSTGANIGTSDDMNTDNAEVTININGGRYVLSSSSSSKTAIGCYGKQSGTITVNKGTVGLSNYSFRRNPVIGFTGDSSAADKTYVINITGGTINAGTVTESCAIGCNYGYNCTVNISGGNITVGIDYAGAGIGSYIGFDTGVNISGGNIVVKSTTPSDSTLSNGGIGSISYSAPCQISLSWRSISNCKIYTDSYKGSVTLNKDFRDNDTSEVFSSGTVESSAIAGRTIVPYCNHSYGEPAWTWNTDSEPYTASANFLCSECGSYLTVEATVTLADNIYTGSVTFNGTTYTDIAPPSIKNLLVSRTEPYIDDDGAYILGNVAYYAIGGKYYAVNEDGDVGEELSANDVFFSYFTFTAISSGAEYRIDKYTGPTDGLTELVIPKTYNGKKITQLGGGGGSVNRVLDYTGEFTLVLNENIIRINNSAFSYCNVRKITGDTSSLNYFDDGSFFAGGSGSDVKPGLDIQLNYPGSVYFGLQSLRWRNVTVHLKHATTLIRNNDEAGSITYDFSDAHLYGEPTWKWNYDNSSATATFTCTDDRCRHQEVVNATISGEGDSATATVDFNGKTYSDAATPMSEKQLVSRTEPYIDSDGAYILGNVAYYAINGKNYAVDSDGDVGEELSSVELSYFTFTAISSGAEYRIDKYTGPTDGFTELVIPKTYNGKKITQLGGGGSSVNRVLDYTGEFTLVLNENITRINRSAFDDCKVRKITGDTSSLNYFDNGSFFAGGSGSMAKPGLDIQLDYPGSVYFGSQSLRRRNVTVHLKHATTLNRNYDEAGSITYDFIDDHIYGDDPEPTWTWASDYSSAAAAFTCTDSRCTHQETPETTVSVETADGNYIYTAVCIFNGKTYTDTVTVPIGDEQNPFVIRNKADWDAFAEKINAGYYTTSYYKLADDFDNSDPITTTVGTSDHPFEGHFDGNGKTLNIALNDTANQGTAPFRYISGADIHDMTVIGSVNGKRHAAGLVGFNGGTSTITDITVNANISATANGEGYIGGVIGHNMTATLTMTNVVYGGTLNNRGNCAGGLFGWSDSSTVTMTDCLFKGSYTGSGSFHPVGCKNASDTVSVTLDRVYYTVDPNFSNSSNILSNDGIRVYTEAPDDRIVGTVRAADGEDYYIPASVSGVESEYDYVITEITPTVTVTAYDGTVLERGIDYTVTYDPATVRTAGDYTVTVAGVGDFAGVYTASFTVTDHNYDDYEWEWSEDLATATLVMKCTDDGCDIESRIPSTVSSKISKGVHVYTAFVFLYGTPYVDSQVGSHTYGEPVWSWSEDYQTSTATFTCTDARCGHAEIVDATVTEAYTADSTTYTASVTFEGAEYTDTKTAESRKYFVGHSLSLTGDIRINYYLNLTDEQAQGAAVDFSWIVNGTEKTHSVTLTAEDKTAYGYLASVPVAVAEMTYDVTATLTVGGEQLASDTYSVRQYADVILSDSFASSYTGTGSRSYENLKTLIQTMLDYGAKAQVQFARNTDNLANKDIDYAMSNVSADMITATPSNMRSGLDAYGLEYAGTTIVYLTKTSMRHYYKIVDQEKFDAVKDNITFEGEKVGYTERNGEIFFEHADIAAADLDELYTLKIGDSEYQYSVLDYVRECLSSPNAPYATVQLVMATYWYNQAANAYFGR